MSGTKRKAISAYEGPSKSVKTNSVASPAAKVLLAENDASKTTASTLKPIKATQLKEEEPLFPRGGGSALTSLEQKQIKTKAAQDALFEETSNTNKPRANEKKRRREKKNHEAKQEERVKIESLNLKRLVKGSLVLGQVIDITHFGLSIALPNNLIGNVALTDISDEFSHFLAAEAAKDDHEDEANDPIIARLKSFFFVGQYLRFYVLSTYNESKTKLGKPRPRIELSVQQQLSNTGLEPDHLAPGATLVAHVASVEDHGYVMDIGFGDKLRGFLLRKEVDESDADELPAGAVRLCVVTSKIGPKVVQLASRLDKVGKPKSTLNNSPTIDAFLPGTQAELLVTNLTSGGLVGKIAGSIDATADIIHSGLSTGYMKAEKLKVGSKHRVRIVCNFPIADHPKVGVSFLPHLLSLTPNPKHKDSDKDSSPLDSLPVSSFVDECKVRRVEPGIGLFVDLGQDLLGFVHISRVKDGKVESLQSDTGPYKLDSVHRGRILSYNHLDGLFQVTFEKSVLDQRYLRLHDVEIGDLVQGTIEKVLVRSEGIALVVGVANGINGLVNNIHLSDVIMKHPERKFRVGMKVKARVLSKDVPNRHLRFTLKKSLVNSDSVPIQSFNQVEVGMKVPGTIVKVFEKGAIVQFYGSLRGFLPLSEMSEAFIEDPRNHFTPGQTLSLRVIEVNSKKERLILSYRDPTVQVPEEEKEISTVTLEAGRFNWNAQIDESDAASTESNNEIDLPKRKKRKTQAIITGPNMGSDTATSLTAADFDKRLIHNINDSTIWIEYIAFMITNGDLAKGREVAERAIASINPVEQAERLNVWVAYMNLELLHGTEESLEGVFSRACQYQDEREVYEKLISIYIRDGKHKEANDLFQRLLKKFGAKVPDVWINYANFLHNIAGEPNEARDLLPRAIQRLGQNNMIGLTSRFAALEYRAPQGIPERGHTLFEGILDSFPKRMDIWNQLVDLEISCAQQTSKSTGVPGRKEVVRQVFEKGAAVKGLKPHTAKKWFKRWAEWEENKGDGEAGRIAVMKKAAEWVKAAEAKKGVVDEK